MWHYSFNNFHCKSIFLPSRAVCDTIHSLYDTTYPLCHITHPLCHASSPVCHTIHRVCHTTHPLSHTTHSLCQTTNPFCHTTRPLCHTAHSIYHATHSGLVSVSVFVILSIVFHSINSPDNPSLSHSVLSVFFSALSILSTIYLFIKVSISPDIILCGWLGLKHHLTNHTSIMSNHPPIVQATYRIVPLPPPFRLDLANLSHNLSRQNVKEADSTARWENSKPKIVLLCSWSQIPPIQWFIHRYRAN